MTYDAMCLMFTVSSTESSSPVANLAPPMIEDPEDWADQVSDALSEVHHDLKNPLSIISGNAQFLMEIGREADWDDQAVASLRDIEEAAERLESSLNRLSDLRDEL